MQRLIFGPTRVSSGDGSTETIRLSPRPVGWWTGQPAYFIKVLAKSSDAAKVGLVLDHGATPDEMTNHSTVISLTRLNASPYDEVPCLLGGTADTSTYGQVGEWLRITLLVGSASAEQWVTLEVYEVIKPY